MDLADREVSVKTVSGSTAYNELLYSWFNNCNHQNVFFQLLNMITITNLQGFFCRLYKIMDIQQLGLYLEMLSRYWSFKIHLHWLSQIFVLRPTIKISLILPQWPWAHCKPMTETQATVSWPERNCFYHNPEGKKHNTWELR